MNNIARETFQVMDEASKLNVLFDYARESNECSCRLERRIDCLEKRFERGKKIDSTVAGIMGLIGGAVAYISSYFIKK